VAAQDDAVAAHLICFHWCLCACDHGPAVLSAELFTATAVCLEETPLTACSWSEGRGMPKIAGEDVLSRHAAAVPGGIGIQNGRHVPRKERLNVPRNCRQANKHVGCWQESCVYRTPRPVLVPLQPECQRMMSVECQATDIARSMDDRLRYLTVATVTCGKRLLHVNEPG
jgi:hypothetical protein